jgi:exonuclease SbcC
MRIYLKKLTITNFKGIPHFEVAFNHITNIFGENGTGKTTIFDAFLWLFFSKNTEGKSDFEAKRLDEKNKFIKDLEAEVSAILHIDGQEICVKKVLRQKWVKRRGELNSNYNGDENIYYWNDVPLKESEFKTKIKAIIDENLFRLITNPFYFNSLNWKERRNILIDIAGNISNSEVFDKLLTTSNKQQYQDLINALNQNKSLDEYKREIAEKKKKIKDEAESIPSRIDEVRRGMPEEKNFEVLCEELNLLNAQLDLVKSTLDDEVEMQKELNQQQAELLREYNKQVQDRQQKIFSLKTKLQNIEFEVKQQAREQTGKTEAEINSIIRQLAEKKPERERLAGSLKINEQQLADKNILLQEKRDAYNNLGAEELKFDDQEFKCPACKQDLPAGDLDAKKTELIENFNKSKLQKLAVLKNHALEIKSDIESLTLKITNAKNSIHTLDNEIGSLNAKLLELKEEASKPKQSAETIVSDALLVNEDHKRLLHELNETTGIIIEEPKFDPVQTNNELKEKQQKISDRISLVQKELNDEELINKASKRIIELQDQESKLAQELANLEGVEFAILQFTKAKVDAIERRINGKFKFVKFKMFNTQVNGGETEACETLISGVPFSDANNAAKINAGIDIINTLCDHYSAFAPMFIDNRESVTKLIDSDSQIVNLFVHEGALLSVDVIKWNPKFEKNLNGTLV